MGIASMVLGIVSLILGLVPFCNIFAIIPSLVGLGLGVADFLVKRKTKKGRGMGIAGLILNPLAIIVTVGWYLFIYSEMRTVSHDWQQIQQFQNIPTFPSGTGSSADPPMQPMQPVDPPTPDTAAPPPH